MKLTHYGHSTIALNAPEGRIVFDPGPFSDLSCLEGAAAIMLTHAHADHLAVDAVKESGLPVWGTQEVVDTLGAGTAVSSGEIITVLGQEIAVVGGLHEAIHPSIPRPVNVGYFTEGFLHPGDQYIEVDQPVSVLLLAISGPWVKGIEAAEYGKRVGAQRTIPGHDALLSEAGMGVMDNFMKKVGVPGYERLPVGESIEL